MINKDNHPCFSEKACSGSGRIHLPVAPKCNMQCNYCNRKFDCVNESRPGVTSHLLSPGQALAYYREAKKKMPFLAVVGIAGPGDPFANPEETMETLRLIRAEDPDVILCVATNGLNVLPYIDEMADLEVSHVTITCNAVDPEISTKIYSWFRYGKRVYRRREGAELLLENQINAVKKLKSHGITVKINSIIVPGVNEDHIIDVARTMKELGVDYHNCLPYYKTKGSVFEQIEEPEPNLTSFIREESSKYIPQMKHCQRCRADAVGLLRQDRINEMEEILGRISRGPLNPDENRDAVAVASYEGFLVNQHLGEALKLLVFREQKDGSWSLAEERQTPVPGLGEKRWARLAEKLPDCHSILVSGAGPSPKKVLGDLGIRVFEVEGLISQALETLKNEGDLSSMKKQECTTCGSGTACTGNGYGCM